MEGPPLRAFLGGGRNYKQGYCIKDDSPPNFQLWLKVRKTPRPIPVYLYKLGYIEPTIVVLATVDPKGREIFGRQG